MNTVFGAFRLAKHSDVDFADLVVWHSPFGECIAAMKPFGDTGERRLGGMSKFPCLAHMSEAEVDGAMALLNGLPDEIPVLGWSSSSFTLGFERALVRHRRCEDRRTAHSRALAMLPDADRIGARVGYSALGVHIRAHGVQFVENADLAIQAAINSANRFRGTFSKLIRADAAFVEPFSWLN